MTMNTTHIQRCQRCGIVLLSMLCTAPAWADGTITHLSGEVSVQKKDGTTLPGTAGTKVAEGDVMITGASGYGRLEMTDGGEMILRPNSQLKVESYRFNPDKPTEDSFVFRMLKGGLRTVTGLIGKRGNKDAYEGKTTTATIGIRGTQFDLRLCQGDCGALQDGTYLAVRFGAVRTGNAQGSLDVAAGQVAMVQHAKPPVMLPRDPGIGFTPPPTIPKLDEKKKVQAAAASAAAPAQAKPASGGSGQQSTKQGGGQAASGTSAASGDSSSGSANETKEGSGSDTGAKPGAGSGTSTGTSDSGTTSTSTNASSATSSNADGGTSTNRPSSSAAPAQTATLPPTLSPSPQTAPGSDCSVQ
jgi:hypothetical protein